MEELSLVRPTGFGGPPIIGNKIYSEFKVALSLAVPHQSSEARTAEELRLLQQFSKRIPRRCRSITISGAMVSSAVLSCMNE
jgi:hypothetical protein